MRLRLRVAAALAGATCCADAADLRSIGQNYNGTVTGSPGWEAPSCPIALWPLHRLGLADPPSANPRFRRRVTRPFALGCGADRQLDLQFSLSVSEDLDSASAINFVAAVSDITTRCPGWLTTQGHFDIRG